MMLLSQSALALELRERKSLSTRVQTATLQLQDSCTFAPSLRLQNCSGSISSCVKEVNAVCQDVELSKGESHAFSGHESHGAPSKTIRQPRWLRLLMIVTSFSKTGNIHPASFPFSAASSSSFSSSTPHVFFARFSRPALASVMVILPSTNDASFYH